VGLRSRAGVERLTRRWGASRQSRGEALRRISHWRFRIGNPAELRVCILRAWIRHRALERRQPRAAVRPGDRDQDLVLGRRPRTVILFCPSSAATAAATRRTPPVSGEDGPRSQWMVAAVICRHGATREKSRRIARTGDSGVYSQQRYRDK